VTWEQLHYPDNFKAVIRDLWRRQDLPPAQGAFTAAVQGHGIVMVTVKP
jgi:alpha-galactosidase